MVLPLTYMWYRTVVIYSFASLLSATIPSSVPVVSSWWDTGWTGRQWITRVSHGQFMKVSANQQQHYRTPRLRDLEELFAECLFAANSFNEASCATRDSDISRAIPISEKSPNISVG
jgi:hypothetical protein